MRLELDVGNSYIKWRLLDVYGEIKDRGAIATAPEAVSFFAESYFYNQVNELLVSSVASSKVLDAICDLFDKQVSTSDIFKAKASKVMCGVEFVYDDVSRLGVDRCLAMVAAYAENKQGVIVVDCGSAITVDLVLSTGRHVGGYILPGFNLLKRSLLKGTSNVIVNSDVGQSFDFGVNTEECVSNGVNMMIRSTLNGVVKLAENYGVREIILTGGDGLKAKEFLGKEVIYDQDLVFKGLSMVGSYS